MTQRRRPAARQLQDRPEPFEALGNPNPSPTLRDRAESGMERFLRSFAPKPAEKPET
ncbi:hypothetical protein ACIQU4_38635 [Streptomyces sp. NPDC090741]|uniref:hypothetical protein n=1 Tax=Streptomyces sp. NPDC090741 TaxID=3365967 RepID=UPI003819CA40